MRNQLTDLGGGMCWLWPQSTYRGRVEIGGVYLPSQRIPQLCTPSPGWANFNIMMECTPDSGNCHSVCTLWGWQWICGYMPRNTNVFCTQHKSLHEPRTAWNRKYKYDLYFALIPLVLVHDFNQTTYKKRFEFTYRSPPLHGNVKPTGGFFRFLLLMALVSWFPLGPRIN